MALNALAPQFVPDLAGGLRAERGQILVTEPLAERPCHGSFGTAMAWWRELPEADGRFRLLFGGGRAREEPDSLFPQFTTEQQPHPLLERKPVLRPPTSSGSTPNLPSSFLSWSVSRLPIAGAVCNPLPRMTYHRWASLMRNARFTAWPGCVGGGIAIRMSALIPWWGSSVWPRRLACNMALLAEPNGGAPTSRNVGGMGEFVPVDP
ncbi:MAG: hypothetical protein R2867_11630 [Caldilineaceae bacterium]